VCGGVNETTRPPFIERITRRKKKRRKKKKIREAFIIPCAFILRAVAFTSVSKKPPIVCVAASMKRRAHLQRKNKQKGSKQGRRKV